MLSWALYANAAALSGAAAPSWTPATVSANLAWWAEPKPANLTKLGGGTPVDGDQVSAITDLSGNSIVLSQSTTGDYPIYHTDGTHYWLTFNGTSMSLNYATAFAITDASGQHTAFSTVNPSSTTSVQSILNADQQGGSGARVSQILRTNAGTLESLEFAGGSPFTDAGPSVGSGTAHVVSEITQTASVEAFVDGTGNGSTAITGALATTTTGLGVGAKSGNQQFYSGNWYGGFIYKGVMGSTDLTGAQTYMRALAA